MSVCVYSVFVLSCVQVAALRRADPSSKESYRLCESGVTEKAAKVQQKDCRAIKKLSSRDTCNAFDFLLIPV
jgi:hypothetical protein